MTQLAELVGSLWRAALVCHLTARATGWLSPWRWAAVLYTAATALAWSLRWAGGVVFWEAL